MDEADERGRWFSIAVAAYLMPSEDEAIVIMDRAGQNALLKGLCCEPNVVVLVRKGFIPK